jgi:hypothetical protein
MDAGIRVRPSRAFAVLLLVTLALASCGDYDEDKVSDAVRGYFSALAGGEYGKACDRLAASAKRDAARYAAEQLPELGTVECESILRQIFELADEEQVERLENVSVREVSIDGDSATAEVEGATQTAKLKKVDGDWKIAELDFEGTATGSAPPTDQPEEPESEPSTPPASGETDAIRGRLETAGFTVEAGDLGSGEPTPEGALDVALDKGGEVTIYVYSSAADAARSEADFKPVEKESPDQIEVDVRGSVVYVGTIEEPAKLPTSEFQRVVDTAEG